VNIFTTTSYNTSKYNPLLNIQHNAGGVPRVNVASWYWCAASATTLSAVTK